MMDKTPLYKYPGDYAREKDELEQYRASHKANVACKDAIETAIRDNYRDNRLGKEGVKQVADQFGYERMFYVLANTVQRKDFDGRIFRDNKDWAKTIPVFEDKDYFGDDRRSEFEVDSCNPRPHGYFHQAGAARISADPAFDQAGHSDRGRAAAPVSAIRA